jgi:hypothetical protein
MGRTGSWRLGSRIRGRGDAAKFHYWMKTFFQDRRVKPTGRTARGIKWQRHQSKPKATCTAVYGPVCPMVWEGEGRKAFPHPDLSFVNNFLEKKLE